MKPYLLSLGLGLLIGIIYNLSGVRSPAPPIIALVGLLGILLGEQALPTLQKVMSPPIASDKHQELSTTDASQCQTKSHSHE